MRDDLTNREVWGLTAMLCATLAFFCVVSFAFGYGFAEKHMRREAMRHGVASYVADENGYVEFKWKSMNKQRVMK